MSPHPYAQLITRAIPMNSTLSLHDALPIWAVRSTCMPGRATRSCSRFLPRCCAGRNAPGCARSAGPAQHLGRKRSEEHTSELQSRFDLVCGLLLEKKKEIPLKTLFIVYDTV